ncbi:glutathione S-transferase T3 [Medicago truncatula]|uniref:glutathione S-transferase T3 n=1 Tax=Medicago truncatula TaxID=3880 RepID=UPI00196739BB|nr:glutathione S-transferase T3 [Medicago truncatula]
MGNENFPSVDATQYPEFSTQITPGGMAVSDEVTPEDSTPKSKRSKEPAWNTQQNLVLISAWIKYGTSSVVGRNQRGETYWGKIAEYCNEYCSFDSPRDLVACRNRFNYMSKIINKWIGAYESAKRMQGSGWSEDDILTKAQELFAGGKNIQFTLKEEWHALRDQPRYGSQMGGNVGSGSSGSKRSHEDSVGSSARPMGREAAKKKKNKLLQEKTQAKKMKMYLKLRDEEHLDDRKKELLENLERELFEN